METRKALVWPSAFEGLVATANSSRIGEALRRWGGKREDIFITEKILSGLADIKGTIKRQLSDVRNPLFALGIEYVDLYLLHAPDKIFPKGAPSLEDAFSQLEQIKNEGLVKSIGVSNHRVKDLERIVKSSKTPPAVNQIELHPYIISEAQDIVDYCKQHDIKLEAYSPSAPVVYFKDGPANKVLDQVAAAVSKRSGESVTTGQILLKWAAQKGNIIITTSSKESRMKEQLAALALSELSTDEMTSIEDAGRSEAPRRKYMANVFTQD
ncbi:hypothetical protein EMMF5_005154 [Cystobasidiomycetes sp. EMM_F5]